MNINRRRSSAAARQMFLLASVLASIGGAIVMAVPAASDRPVEAPTPQAAAPPDGKELFVREWIAGDPRSHRGDGLGPMFNDTSCVACHNQGGAGGGGPLNKNVQILTTSGLGNTRQSGALQSFVL